MFRKLIFCSVLCCFFANFLRGDDVITVMTYNIYLGGHGMDQKHDFNRTLKVIESVNPDLGALNEVDQYVARSNFIDPVIKLRSKFNYSVVFAQALAKPNKDKAAGGYGVLAMGKKRLQVIKQFALPLPSHFEPRTVLIVKTVEPNPIYLITTHLPWENTVEAQKLRTKCLELITKEVKENNYTPAILMGDFNATPDTEALKTLRKEWFICNDSNPQATYPANKPTHLIDYIAFYPKDAFELQSMEALAEPLASDHLPLVAKLKRN